ncbi:MAG TPA: hypothetical protein DIC52_04300 [Candidatus Latescibacteria bacterium]|nr:hypothetical protein [Candidatus Latescibacterota bacterium]
MPGVRGAWLAAFLVVPCCQPVLAAVPNANPELLIRLSPGAARPAPQLDSLHAVSGLRSLERLLPARGYVARAATNPPIERWLRLRFDGRLSVEALVQRYRAASAVEAIQPNYLRRQTAYRTDDPLLDKQWNLDAIGWTQRDPGSAAGVLVAVVDSGVDGDHPDLAAQIWHNSAELDGLEGFDDDGNGYVDDIAGWDFTDAPGLPGDGDFTDPDADPEDESGHGTHVAGIIAAASDNGIGITGIAPGASLMVLRAGFNIGSSGYLQDDDVAAAIVYAADNGAQVINLSLGDPRYSPLMADAVRYAIELDVVVVAAAGNEGSAEVYYPARLDGTIGVAASGRSDLPASFSNRGTSIDLIAPGVAVHSATLGGGYGDLSGTSMAAPHVSAVAALIRARHPEYSRLQVLGALVSAAQDVGAAGWDEYSGHGLLRVPVPLSPQPLAVRFVRPATDREVSVDTVDIEARVVVPEMAEYDIDWGPGRSPRRWQALASGTLGRGEGEIGASWFTAGLAPGPYTIRAQLLDGTGRAHEDRVVVELVNAGAALSDLRLARVLQGPRWQDVVEWTTDRAAAGAVELMTAGQLALRISVPEGRTQQVVRLPQDLPPGSYAVRVFSGEHSLTAQESLFVQPAGVRRWDLATLAHTREDGYLLPRFTDFDGDGRGELVAMIYGGGAYGSTNFFEEDELSPVFATTRLFIPWETGDFDLDGVTDLMGVDGRRVRLFEAETGESYPGHVAWEQRDVWGGEVFDLDGDGRPEMILRSATANLFRIFETDGDNGYAEIAALVNDTPGENEMGDRQSVGDLDGDGRGEWVSGDSDGDLVIFESVADNAYRSVWVDQVDAEHVDGRLLSAAADLDGDGELEFISGRLLRDPFEVESRRWTLSVFGATHDNDYEIEWQAQVFAGTSSGNGITITDLDGDGRLEWAVVLVPHLYVFQAAEEGGYEAVWHTPVRRTHRPAAGDLDGDGRQELAYNLVAGGIETRRWQVPGGDLFAPAAWVAAPAGPDRVRLTWEGVRDAVAYRLRRDDEEVARIVDDQALRYAYIDSALTAGESYLYDLAAIADNGSVGHHTPILSVVPGALPKVIGARRVSSTQLTVEFDQSMGLEVAQPFRYRLQPEVATAEAVIVDRSRRRAVVAFAVDLPDGGLVSLHFSGLRSATGAPLATASVDFELITRVAATRLLEVMVTDPLAMVARFDRPLALAEAVVIVDGGAIQVQHLALGADGLSVEIELSSATPLRPLGRRYEVQLTGFIDDLGRAVEGRAFVNLQAQQLDEILIFPNPVDPLTQQLSVAGLPLGSRVQLFTLNGDLLWSGQENDGDGGLQWNGRNRSGEPVAAGVYLLLAQHQGRSRRARFAVLPGR